VKLGWVATVTCLLLLAGAAVGAIIYINDEDAPAARARHATGFSLRFYDDSEQYESLTIQPGDFVI
jgi:hypothetical protein